MRFDPSRSILAGMDLGVLQARLNQMQGDYLDLMSGRKAVSANYAQDDGAKSVTYTTANIGELSQAILLLQAQLGIVTRPRAPFRVRFR